MAKGVKRPEERAADEVYSVLVRRFGRFNDFVTLRKRLRDLLADHGNDYEQVTLVALVAAEQAPGAGFETLRLLGPVNFLRIRDNLGVPDGAWRYAYWAHREADPKVLQSVQYWLGVWHDAEAAGNFDRQLEAQTRLAELWDDNAARL